MIYDTNSPEFIKLLVETDGLRLKIDKNPNLAKKLYGSNYYSNWNESCPE